MSSPGKHGDPGAEKLEAHVRAHFEALRRVSAVPSFDSVMMQVEAERAHSKRKRAEHTRAKGTNAGIPAINPGLRVSGLRAGALAAGLLVVLIVLGTDGGAPPSESEVTRLARLPAGVSVSEGTLLAELGGTTRWRAPSDYWPVAPADLDVLGMPVLGTGATDGIEETARWL